MLQILDFPSSPGRKAGGAFALRMEERMVRCGRMALRLPPQEIALLCVYAVARRDKWAGAGPEGVGDGHGGWIETQAFVRPKLGRADPFGCYLNAYRAALDGEGDDAVRRLQALARRDPLGLQQFFQRKRTLLDKALRAEGPAFEDARLKAVLVKPHRAGLMVEPERIVIEG